MQSAAKYFPIRLNVYTNVERKKNALSAKALPTKPNNKFVFRAEQLDLSSA